MDLLVARRRWVQSQSIRRLSLSWRELQSPSNVAALVVRLLESLPMSREMIEVEDWDEVGYEVAIATVDGRLH